MKYICLFYQYSPDWQEIVLSMSMPPRRHAKPWFFFIFWFWLIFWQSKNCWTVCPTLVRESQAVKALCCSLVCLNNSAVHLLYRKENATQVQVVNILLSWRNLFQNFFCFPTGINKDTHRTGMRVRCLQREYSLYLKYIYIIYISGLREVLIIYVSTLSLTLKIGLNYQLELS